MATWLRVSTSADVMLGPFLDSTDGNTVEGSLTITQPDIRLSKNGAAFAQKSSAQTLTHAENGWYSVSLSTTDTNTLGPLTVAIHESGALPVWREFLVVPANVYDSFFSTDFLQVDITQLLGSTIATPTVAGVLEADVTHWLGTAAATPTIAGVPEVDITHIGGVAQSAADLKDFADAGYDPSTNKVQGVVLVDTVTDLADNAINAATLASDTITAVKIAADAITSAHIADGAIDAGTFAAGAITAAATNSDFLSEINAEVDIALADYDAPTFAEMDARTDAIEADTQDIQARLPAALVSGRMDSSVGAMAPSVITDAAVATELDSYTAKVWAFKQGTTKDEYVVLFYKNAVPIESGITTPVIDYVKKMSDGSILINDATLTEQSNGDYIYSESTNKLVPGNAYTSRITATIDGSTRVMKQPVGRDSA